MEKSSTFISQSFLSDSFQEMTCSAQNQLAQLLNSITNVHLLYSGSCIADSYAFAEKVLTADLAPSVFLCSFDICSLSSNGTLAETIDICATALYHSELKPLPFSRTLFIKLMQMATSLVEFSFNNVMKPAI